MKRLAVIAIGFTVLYASACKDETSSSGATGGPSLMDQAKKAAGDMEDVAKRTAADAAAAAEKAAAELKEKGASIAADAGARAKAGLTAALDALTPQFEALKTRVAGATDPAKRLSGEGLLKGLSGQFDAVRKSVETAADDVDWNELSKSVAPAIEKLKTGLAEGMKMLGG